MRNLELPGRSPVHSPDGMAATSQPLATQTAIEILKAGGNAMDAAIAACAVQCVVEPGSTGIGGDCFCLYAPKATTDVIAFNGSGRAPTGATPEWFAANGITKLERPSPHCVTVPGAADAWFQLNRDHGRMSLTDILAPAIHYARDGFPVSSRVSFDFSRDAEFLKLDENTARIYLPGGKPPAVGQMHRLPELAGTLQAFAEGGRDAFYTGAIAEDMVSYLQAKGGLHTMEDFATAAGEYVTPISTTFRGLEVFECPPNGQGVIALLLLNIMSGVEVDPAQRAAGPVTAERIHLEIEACRQAYRARTQYLADPAMSHVPVEEILSDAYAQSCRDAIDPAKASVPPADPGLPKHKDTVYLTVVDKDRNVCSFINTVFWGWGSGLTAPKSGVVFTNRGEGFSLDPAHPNCIAPGKRPLHTIIPAMAAKDGRIQLSFGVMGGDYQSFGQMQFLTRYLDFGMDIQQAMDAPRFMADPVTGDVEMECGVPDDIRAELTRRGHTIVDAEDPVGGSQAIAIDWDQGDAGQSVLTGGSDPRKDGCAIGY